MPQCTNPFESFQQTPDDEFRSDEVSAASLVGLCFPFSRLLVRSLLHDESIDVLEPNEKFIGALRRTVAPGCGRGRLKGAQNVMRVFIAVFDDLAVEDD